MKKLIVFTLVIVLTVALSLAMLGCAVTNGDEPGYENGQNGDNGNGGQNGGTGSGGGQTGGGNNNNNNGGNNNGNNNGNGDVTFTNGFYRTTYVNWEAFWTQDEIDDGSTSDFWDFVLYNNTVIHVNMWDFELAELILL